MQAYNSLALHTSADQSPGLRHLSHPSTLQPLTPFDMQSLMTKGSRSHLGPHHAQRLPMGLQAAAVVRRVAPHLDLTPWASNALGAARHSDHLTLKKCQVRGG